MNNDIDFKLARTIVCRNVRLSSQLAQNAKKGLKPLIWRPNLPALPNYAAWQLYLSIRREAAIWHAVACLMKGGVDAAKRHVSGSPKLMKLAGKRKVEIQHWVDKNPVAAQDLCAPLFAEYEARAKRRAEKEVKA